MSRRGSRLDGRVVRGSHSAGIWIKSLGIEISCFFPRYQGLGCAICDIFVDFELKFVTL